MRQSSIQKLLDAYQGNVYPAMLDDLASHVGVSPESIRRLGVGWAPVVPFKRGPSFLGWWVIPERNEEGLVTGLSLRSQNDSKVAYPGSKHGLVYELNPHHSEGEHGYFSGAHNWCRTMDAGVTCPVCGKPDGCLVSAENPQDPKATVCIRVSTNAAKPLKFGHLHILKATGLIQGAGALIHSTEPVVIVEGFTDAATAMDLGFVGVGRPSNLACMGMLADLVRGRKCIIVGENDHVVVQGKDTYPGKEGMTAAFQIVRKTCRDVTAVMPPEGIKDLRVWRRKHGLTREIFLAHVQAHGQTHTEETVIPDDRPLTIARSFLASAHRMAKRYTLRRWANQWYTYAGTRYDSLDEEALVAPMYDWAHDKHIPVVTTKGENIRPIRADKGFISNIVGAMAAETLIPSARIPCWINGVTGADPRDLIVFANGIVHVPSFLENRSEAEYLHDLTPDYFTTVSLPFSFDATATCPTWMRFLRETLGDDGDKIRLLREWFGYCLTPDTSMQKLMYMRGPSGAGKTVCTNILTKLVGEDQAASTSFADLSGPFGVQSLVGKMLCVIPDARTPRHGDHMRGLELLLNIASGDPININRKFKDPLDLHRLIARVTIASNEFLEVADHAGAMLRRLNVIEWTKSFAGNPDIHLERKLTDEIPGIAVWALGGLRRLRQQGSFTVPQSSVDSLREWRLSTSPIAGFLEECTEQSAAGEANKQELYDCWTGWANERRIGVMSMGRWMERIKQNAPYCASLTYEKGGHKFSVYRGLSIKPWARRKFTGAPPQ